MFLIGCFAQANGWGASRKNGRKNQSLKEERTSAPPLYSENSGAHYRNITFNIQQPPIQIQHYFSILNSNLRKPKQINHLGKHLLQNVGASRKNAQQFLVVLRA